MKPVKLPYEDYLSIYQRVPRLCVDLLLITGDGLLLSRRDIEPGKGLWHFPGGTVLMGESIEDALKRIALDETGLRVFNPRFIDVMEFNGKNNLFFHTVSLVYKLDMEDAVPRGSKQGKTLKFLKDLPEGMIEEQKELVLKHQLLHRI